MDIKCQIWGLIPVWHEGSYTFSNMSVNGYHPFSDLSHLCMLDNPASDIFHYTKWFLICLSLQLKIISLYHFHSKYYTYLCLLIFPLELVFIFSFSSANDSSNDEYLLNTYCVPDVLHTLIHLIPWQPYVVTTIIILQMRHLRHREVIKLMRGWAPTLPVTQGRNPLFSLTPFHWLPNFHQFYFCNVSPAHFFQT